MYRSGFLSVFLIVLLAAGSQSDAADVFSEGVRSYGLATRKRHERLDVITALPGFEGRMPSRQYGGYITGDVC